MEKNTDKGNPFGAHRVIEPKGVLPQPAQKLDNSMDRIWDNEILVDVEVLNVDSASFTQIKEEANGDEKVIADIILKTVAERGKQHNPVTGSGGMFIGTVNKVGAALKNRDLKKGDQIASLVSLSLTPLHIEKILKVKKEIDQVVIKGKAILFESAIYAKLPNDMPAGLALAALDVAGAPAQAARLAKKGDTVAILGATGKSGILCAWALREKIGNEGRIIGLGHSAEKCKLLESLSLCDEVIAINATDALECHKTVSQLTHDKMANLVINCVNIPNTEMASILMCQEEGTVYFFSMATSFTKAALGAEGVGKDISMIIGNGYARGHADLTLSILRKSKTIRELYEKLYA
ncbi:MAG: L-erythro-3,5-diaminohexanoate dehydrogenase [Fibrobacteria bacterium]|nr:L-erythro-3,5-diaminohexanoate dehydrogenase [Fibrobacteria bacterium]